MVSDLRQYDGKCVRITGTNGAVSDGICEYNVEEFNEHELGRCEDSLSIVNFVFFKGDIESVEVLEETGGPFSPFRDAFGDLEREAAGDVYDTESFLFCEEDEHVLRMLRCLDTLDPLPFGEQTLPMLRELVDLSENERIKNAAQKLCEKWAK